MGDVMELKLQKVLEEIKLKKRNNIYDLEFTIDEYLSKDENGMSFIENLLKYDIFINYRAEKVFGKYNEIVYLYCKYNKSLYNFEFEEDDLFSIYDGKRLIDFIAQSDKLTNHIVKCIKNHLEIVDILVATKSYYGIYLSEEIKEKLMTPDNRGIYPIEKYFNNEEQIAYLIGLINHPKQLIELCKKYNKYNLLEKANENVLMYQVDENYTVVQDLFNKGIIPEKLKNIPVNIHFVNYIRKNPSLYEFLRDSSANVLLLKVEDNKTLLEELIEKGYLPKMDFSVYSKEIIEILYQKNRLDLVTQVSESMLLKPVKEIIADETLGNQLLIEYFLDRGYNPLKNCYNVSEDKIIQIMCKKGYYEFLGKKVSEDKLVVQIEENGVCLIDKLLENNIDINFGWCGFKSKEVAKKLYEKNRIDLLIKGNLSVLLTSANEDKTYLDYILDNIKEKNIKFNLNEVSLFNYSVNEIARFYLLVAKHDMMEYISELKEEKLLTEYEGKTLLDELLDLDSKLTIDKVISNKTKSKMKIAIILKSRGLEQNDIDVPLEEKEFSNEYLSSVQNTLGIGPLLQEGEVLLQRLYELFKSDGKSDLSLINALISGYRHALLINYEINIQELRNLVNVKESNMDKFVYEKSEEGAYFSPATGAINCDSMVVETLLHETGHALHYYLANNNVPREYEDVIKSIRDNPETLKKVEAYANKYHNIKENLEDIAHQKYNYFFQKYFNADKTKEIEEFLTKSLIEKKEEFNSLGLPEETLNIILNNSFTSEEYVSHQKRIFIDEYIDSMLRSEFGAFMAIGDILDAIYEGELHSRVLKNENGEFIKGTAGHGISYYYNINNGFYEMIANFASIVKSKDSSETLNLLKSIVGEELYNLLCEFYYDNIVVSKQEQLGETKVI